MAEIDKILLAHGSGGRLMHTLIETLFREKFRNEFLDEAGDAANLPLPDAGSGTRQLCFTTDSYVVNPIFFPGGDIGKLSICGTINDLEVSGARAEYISCGFIVEEGFEYKQLEQIVDSMGKTAAENKVKIVTGDFKVVERKSADKLFINTSGIGFKRPGLDFSRKRISYGDKIIINGSIGDHGIAVIAARGDFKMRSKVISDCAALSRLIAKACEKPDRIKFMRDPTRGGLATTLNEIAGQANFGIVLEEEMIPVKEEVRSICELLGFDPLYLANEGKVVMIVSADAAEAVVKEMRKDKLGREACIIGEVVKQPKGKVLLRTGIKGTRIVDMLAGDQFPRIC